MDYVELLTDNLSWMFAALFLYTWEACRGGEFHFASHGILLAIKSGVSGL